MAAVLSLEESLSEVSISRSVESEREEYRSAGSFADVLQQKSVDNTPKQAVSAAQKDGKKPSASHVINNREDGSEKTVQKKSQPDARRAQEPVPKPQSIQKNKAAQQTTPRASGHTALKSSTVSASASKKTPMPEGKAEVRQNPPATSNRHRLPVQREQIKPIRISTEPAEASLRSAPEKTTVEHLKTRLQDFKGLKEAVRQRVENPVRITEPAVPQSQTITAGERVSKYSKQASRGRAARSGETPLFRVSTKSPKTKTKSVPAKNKQRVHREQAVGEMRTQAHSDSTPVNPHQTSPNEKAIQDRTGMPLRGGKSSLESSSGETRSQQLLGKSQVDVTKGLNRKVSKNEAVAHGTRAVKWMEALTHRTSLMDRSHPHWKVLEMRLDDGDGTVMIKVMRESDHIAVKVGFSDASMQAQAESQTSQILESLRAQYNQDVNLSFTQREGSAFESSAFTAERHQRPSMKTESSDSDKAMTERAPEAFSGENHRVWIG